MRTIGYLFILPALWEWWQAATGKRCPKCRHPLNWHQRRADGSFTD
jgi:hypothetical protein